MSWRQEKEPNGTTALVFDEWQNGIAPSPHIGIGNMRAVNISDSSGEVQANFGRFLQSQNQTTQTGGTITQTSTNTIAFSGSAPTNGTWITVSSSTISGLADGSYYVLTSTQLSATFSRDTATAVTGMGSGTATWAPLGPLNVPVDSSRERYVDTNNVVQYRYYIVDTNGRLWVNDTAFTTIGGEPVVWVLPYPTALSETPCTGMTVAFGTVFIAMDNTMFVVSTVQLGNAPTQFAVGNYQISDTGYPHHVFAGRQGRVYITNGRYIMSIFPNVSQNPANARTIPNIQSYCRYTSSSGGGGVNGAVVQILNGALPYYGVDQSTNKYRIPAFFFAERGGTQPTALTVGTIYYIESTQAGIFNVYTASSGGSALDINTGAIGNQYFNTFWGGTGVTATIEGAATWSFSLQRFQLPEGEVATRLGELGNILVVGTQSNYLYPFNQINLLPSEPVPLPEEGTSQLLTVNNALYVFAGNKGNIYVTNGSSTSLALTVPDYCAYQVEPYFTWGGTMYLRGRIYFSIQDQTASKTGECGGIWSFVPIQNFSYEQTPGMGLRLENQNSYETYNGKTNVLLANAVQTARGPQYWSAWTSSITSPVYGIDYSSTAPVATQEAVIDTDIARTGTMLEKRTFGQVEYKVAAPLVSGESISVEYRTDIQASFTSLGTPITESSQSLSGYWKVDFQKTQWVQFRVTLTPTPTNPSFVRLVELRLR